MQWRNLNLGIYPQIFATYAEHGAVRLMHFSQATLDATTSLSAFTRELSAKPMRIFQTLPGFIMAVQSLTPCDLIW